MTWETPQAIELRFGMEITMYVSNRRLARVCVRAGCAGKDDAHLK